MTARPLAPEADLAHVLDLAKIALRTGTMIDPEDLLCDLLQLDEQQLQEWLDQPMPDELQWDDPALIAAEQAEVEANRQGKPDQSGPAPRARDEYLATGRQWRQAEAGTELHLLEGSRPLCGSHDAGPWRSVAGVAKCPQCVDLAEVLVRHG